jgi:hypothetical protein
MSLDMVIELEGEKPDWNAIKNSAIKVGVESLDLKGNQISFCFLKSRSRLWTVDAGRPREIAAEGKHGCNFLTRFRLIIRINVSMYSESVENIHDFLFNLSYISPMRFVMSFQQEEVQAIRNDRGFEFFWDNPR